MTFLALSDPNLPRVLVVADDPLTRAGLAALLAERTEVNVVGQTASAELSGQLSVYEPTVIAWDVGSGAGIFERMTALEDAPPIVALLTEEALAAQAWLSGARAICFRHMKIDRLAQALVAASHGLAVIDPALVHRLIVPRERNDSAPADPLTGRELEVLSWLAKGLANKAIAQKLTISESTVKFHVNAIMSKLGAQSRTDAVVRATRLGLISL